jgi:tetratricopeptide (TPR) repeat protein
MDHARCLAHTRQYEASNRMFALYLTRGGSPDAYNQIGSNHQMMGQYDLAEQAYTRSAQIIPGRLTPHCLLMRLYGDTGRRDRAAQTAHTLLDMPVKIPSKKADAIKREAQSVWDEWNNQNNQP